MLLFLKCFEALTINTIYSFSVIFMSDMALFFYHDDYLIKDLFNTYQVYFSALLGTYYYLYFYDSIKNLMISDYNRKNRFDWSMSFETFYTIGIFYSSVMFYPAALFMKYPFEKILLVTPASFLVLSLFETSQLLGILRASYALRT
jgi:hypothetical protein